MTRKNLKLIVFSVMTALITLLATAGPALADTPKIKVLIGFNRDVISTSQRDSDISILGGRVGHSFQRIPVVAAELPLQALARLRVMKGISFVEEDGQVQALEEDGDVQILDQQIPWGIARINAPAVWPNNKGTGVKVGIIDTGIDYNNPDLQANYVPEGYDFYNNDSNPMDDNGHGTHVAGIVAAVNNTIGVVGVAPEARLYAIKVLNASGGGSWSNVISGIDWAITHGMQVINMSLGSSSGSTALQQACDAANNAGIVVVAAAGNSGNSGGTGTNTVYPANYSSVVAVAATTSASSNQRASYSSTGPAVDLAAPGDSIYSTVPTNQGSYGTKSGTSMASPHVAGVAALAIASGITDTNGNGRINDEIIDKMEHTAIDLGAANRDNLYGYGLVNASAFAQMNQPPVLSEGGVSPVSGDHGQTFTYSVKYSDANNDAPSSITISIDHGTPPQAMTLQSGSDFISGKTYQYTKSGFAKGSHTFQFAASDSHAAAATHDISEHPGPTVANTPPEAEAGEPQVVDNNEPVTLDGNGSHDADGDALNYAWAQNPADVPQFPLTPLENGQATFTPTQTGEYHFKLTVTEAAGDHASDTDDVTVTVITPNQAPQLTGGVSPDSGYYNDDFTYSVTYTDPEDDPPVGDVTISIDSGAPQAMEDEGGGLYQITFTGKNLGVGTHPYKFAASDGHKTTTLDGTGPTVINTPPTGPTDVTILPSPAYTNDNLTLEFIPGEDADEDDIKYTYEWYRGDDLMSVAYPLPSSATKKGETWTCKVTANDGHEDGGTATSDPVTIRNSPPVANAGPDQTKDRNTLVTLDGSASSDNDTGDIPLNYSWVRTTGPGPVNLSDPSAPNPTFTPTVTGTYEFTLTVSDGSASSPDSVIITVNPPRTIHVESITMSLVYQYSGWRTYAQAVITIRNADNQLVQGATVKGHWTGATRDSDTAITGSGGTVTIASDFRRQPSKGTAYTFTIDSVTPSLSGWTWDTNASYPRTATITVP